MLLKFLGHNLEIFILNWREHQYCGFYNICFTPLSLKFRSLFPWTLLPWTTPALFFELTRGLPAATIQFPSNHGNPCPSLKIPGSAADINVLHYFKLQYSAWMTHYMYSIKWNKYILLISFPKQMYVQYNYPLVYVTLLVSLLVQSYSVNNK